MNHKNAVYVTAMYELECIERQADEIFATGTVNATGFARPPWWIDKERRDVIYIDGDEDIVGIIPWTLGICILKGRQSKVSISITTPVAVPTSF